jgi:hypothetical protein
MIEARNGECDVANTAPATHRRRHPSSSGGSCCQQTWWHRNASGSAKNNSCERGKSNGCPMGVHMHTNQSETVNGRADGTKRKSHGVGVINGVVVKWPERGSTFCSVNARLPETFGRHSVMEIVHEAWFLPSEIWELVFQSMGINTIGLYVPTPFNRT